MSVGPPITVEFQFTRDDYVAWTTALVEKSWQSEHWTRYRRRRSGLAMFAFFVTVVWAMILLYRLPGLIDGRGKGGTLVVSLGGVVAFLWWQVVGAFRRYRAPALERELQIKADSKEVRASYGPVRVTISSGHFEWHGRNGASIQRWTRAGSVERIEGFLLVNAVDAHPSPIPLRAFVDEAAADAFVSAVKAFCSAAPMDEKETLVSLLAERDFRCAGCGYNLRGVREARCPECGRAVEEADLAKSVR